LEAQGEAAVKAREIEEKRIARQQKIVEAASLAQSSKSGLGLSGASAQVLIDQAFQFSLDRNTRLRTGILEQEQLRERGFMHLASGQFAKDVGKSQKQASYVSATSSILKSVGAAYMAADSLSAATPDLAGDQSLISAAGGLDSSYTQGMASNWMSGTGL
jgi:hypothetical protein